MDIRKVLTYTDRCRQKLQQTLGEHPEALDRPIETIGDYRSIRQLLAHCIGAEQRWTEQRLHHLDGTARYEQVAADSLEGLCCDWTDIRAKTHAALEFYLSPDNPHLLHERIAYTMGPWSDALTAEEMLSHVCNHQIYHLGQICMALQQMGIDPPNFDYCFLHENDAF